MQILLPKQVKIIIETLETAGYEAYAVGGCVRDSILKRKPDDWDITTSAKPEQVKSLFRRTIDTGIQHGTVTVLMDGQGFEVTTYRIDGEYTDSRHPKDVSFTDNLTEDLKRRDFTINAMAYSESCGLVDVFGGVQDLENGIIRCVGKAAERFDEDALRILRAVRFAAQLGFEIEEDTQKAASLMAENLRNISAERIQTELVKLLVSSHPEVLKKAYELGLTRIILPEFDIMMETEQNNPHHMYSVGEHTLKALEYVESDKVMRLAVLCHDFGKPASKTTKDGTDHFYGHPLISEQIASQVLHRLKFDNDTIYKVKKLVLYHDTRPSINKEEIEQLRKGKRVVPEKFVRRLIFKVGKELFPQLLQVRGADTLAQSDYGKTEKLILLEQMTEIYEEIVEKDQCLSLKELAVNGKDLLAAGLKPGKQMGEILNRMLEDVLEEPEHNTKEYLMSRYL
ncbi:MAG: CCA tRNA nucleotidyltransferase [Eubacteriales bacterium]|nr:CCA tRNA nucleotidyltransferase [Eubacteriales bacterium]